MTTDSEQSQLTQYDLLIEIERLADELGEVPSISDMKEHGNYGKSVYYSHFDSWTQALDMLGYEPKSSGVPGQKYTNSDLLKEIRRVSEEVDRTPRTRDIREHGKYSLPLYYERFESWGDILEKAGFDTDHHPVLWTPTSVFIDEMLRVFEKVGRVPYKRDMNEHGKIHSELYVQRFGSWGESHEFAGLPPRKRFARTSEYEEKDSSRYGSNWKRKRYETLDRDRWVCQDCGMGYSEHFEEFGRGLNVHHLIPVIEFENPEDANFLLNLITLCEECHKKWEELGRVELSNGGVIA